MNEPTGYTALDLIGFTDRGNYNPVTNYVKNDLVHYGGSIWRILIDDTVGQTPQEGIYYTFFVKEPTNMIEKIMAPLEQNPATQAWAVGRQIINNDYLYEVIAPIAIGDNLVAYEDDPTNANIKLAPPIETQVLAIKNEADKTEDMIAPAESNPAAASHSVGTQIIVDNILYDVTSPIAASDALVAYPTTGYNIKPAAPVSSQIQALKNKTDNLSYDMIIIGASYGNYPSASDNCVVNLKALLSNEYKNIYDNCVNGANFSGGGYLSQIQAVYATVPDPNTIKTILILGIGNDDGADFSTVVLPAMTTFKNYCHSNFPNAEIIIVPVSSRNYKSGIDALFVLYDKVCKNISTHGMKIMSNVYHILALDYTQYFDGTGGHPNSAGAKLIADAIYCGLMGENLSGTYGSNETSTSIVDNPDITASLVNNLIYGTQKGFRLVYNIIFVPNSDIILPFTFGQGLRVCKSPRIRTASAITEFGFETTLLNFTDNVTYNIRIQHVYDSTLQDWYCTVLANTSNVVLKDGKTYQLRANIQIPFDMV